MGIISKRFDINLTEQKMPLICLAPMHSMASETSQLALNPLETVEFPPITSLSSQGSITCPVNFREESYLSYKWKYAKQQQLGNQISVTSRMMKL